MIGLTTIPPENIHKAGCVAGIWQDNNSLLSLTEIYEKPSVEGMAEDEFLCIFCLYLLTP